jgi:hypothetical protein
MTSSLRSVVSSTSLATTGPHNEAHRTTVSVASRFIQTRSRRRVRSRRPVALRPLFVTCEISFAENAQPDYSVVSASWSERCLGVPLSCQDPDSIEHLHTISSDIHQRGRVLTNPSHGTLTRASPAQQTRDMASRRTLEHRASLKRPPLPQSFARFSTPEPTSFKESPLSCREMPQSQQESPSAHCLRLTRLAAPQPQSGEQP